MGPKLLPGGDWCSINGPRSLGPSYLGNWKCPSGFAYRGVPLHLWSKNLFKELGNACRGCSAIDKNTLNLNDCRWIRLLLKPSPQSDSLCSFRAG